MQLLRKRQAKKGDQYMNWCKMFSNIYYSRKEKNTKGNILYAIFYVKLGEKINHTQICFSFFPKRNTGKSSQKTMKSVTHHSQLKEIKKFLEEMEDNKVEREKIQQDPRISS